MASSEEYPVKTCPLQQIIKYRNIHKMKIILPVIKDINEKNDMGYPPLVYACEQEDNDQMLELLIEHPNLDPLVTETRDMQNALHILAFKGKLMWIKKIFEKFPHIPVDSFTEKGNTPLIMAAQMDHVDVIEYLHEKGANVNHSNNELKFTALHYAANNGYTKSTKRLLELGANIEARDARECTPLIKACSWNFLETCKILVHNGADINAENAIHLSSLGIAATREHTTELIKFLLEEGANPNTISKDRYGNVYTPLVNACKAKNVVLMKILIEKGSDVNIPGNYSSALFQCIKEDFYDGVVELIKAGVNLYGKQNHGRTALGLANYYKKYDIASLIQENL
ncbi:unnamed protein product [Psylliodes chrysocephalus]|uniref:Ankyrin repeat protein n=1 Tax=Psylliodes chrysocephalus TaxID=3402493 RepID=A0A9P0CHL4_9CUCU|nr:unnamed protein product [Psylliodes chrysocephala]